MSAINNKRIALFHFETQRPACGIRKTFRERLQVKCFPVSKKQVHTWSNTAAQEFVSFRHRLTLLCAIMEPHTTQHYRSPVTPRWHVFLRAAETEMYHGCNIHPCRARGMDGFSIRSFGSGARVWFKYPLKGWYLSVFLSSSVNRADSDEVLVSRLPLNMLHSRSINVNVNSPQLTAPSKCRLHDMTVKCNISWLALMQPSKVFIINPK